MKETDTHIQCEDCLAWVPKSWPVGKHDCPPFLKMLVLAKKKKDAREIKQNE